MNLQVTSWGKKYGKVPKDFVAVDCTSLRNPYLVRALKPLNGLDPAVAAFVSRPVDTNPYALEYILKYADLIVDKRRGRHIAFVCMGGRHRSVVVAEMWANSRRKAGDTVEVNHPHLEGELEIGGGHPI